MASIQVMRFETKAKLGAQVQLVRHINGTTRPETAQDKAVVRLRDPAELGAVVPLDGEGMGVARAALDKAMAARKSKRGRPPNECIDFLFAGPPPHGTADSWPVERELAWYEATRDVLREIVGPRSVIVTCDGHRDETSPHVQGLVIPIDSRGRVGWCAVRDETCRRLRGRVDEMRAAVESRIAQRRAAGEVVPDLPPPSVKSRYGVLQDYVYFRVSRRFGLERGEVGSQAVHADVDRTKAAEAALLAAKTRHAQIEARTAKQLERERVRAEQLRVEREAVAVAAADVERERAAVSGSLEIRTRERDVARAERDSARDDVLDERASIDARVSAARVEGVRAGLIRAGSALRHVLGATIPELFKPIFRALRAGDGAAVDAIDRGRSQASNRE